MAPDEALLLSIQIKGLLRPGMMRIKTFWRLFAGTELIYE
jgi:hypothetical protein